MAGYNCLGVFDGLNASACLIQDGVLTHAVQEERFTNKKNQAGMPLHSIKWILGDAHPKLDAVALSTRFIHSPAFFSDFKWMKRGKREQLANQSTWWMQRRVNPYYSKRTETRAANLRAILSLEDVPRSVPIKVIDHHTAHAASAYYSSALRSPIVVTMDGSGDGLSETVSVTDEKGLHRISQRGRDDSLGEIYAVSTYILGFKPLEHEYKLMGMAPYGKVDPDVVKGLELLMAKRSTKFIYPELKKLYEGKRLDNICASLQDFFERTMLGELNHIARQLDNKQMDWCFAGGDFMNVKANMLIQEQPCIRESFIMPSASDESTSIGAAQQVYANLCLEHGEEPREKLKPIGALYLGPAPKAPSDPDLNIYKCRNIEKYAAEMIAEGRIVARCSGRMEFGARALGNRSIMADPRDLGVIDRLNKAIKMRDFWMPFTPSIMYEHAEDYVQNPRGLYTPYMITCLRSTDNGRRELPAAMHRYDYTIRPQMVRSDWNPEYYGIISNFRDMTGVAGILNTSFNLHGYPIVLDEGNAVWTLNNSGLDALIVGDTVVEK
jgi:carbamoyltransferase